jgi:hypothetical protein
LPGHGFEEYAGEVVEVHVSERARRALEALEPGADLAGSIEAVALDALRLRLRQCVDEIGRFEARYGATFEQWAADWQAGAVAEARSYGVERDYMEWEALAMELQELLALIRELTAPARADV